MQVLSQEQIMQVAGAAIVRHEVTRISYQIGESMVEEHYSPRTSDKIDWDAYGNPTSGIEYEQTWQLLWDVSVYYDLIDTETGQDVGDEYDSFTETTTENRYVWY